MGGLIFEKKTWFKKPKPMGKNVTRLFAISQKQVSGFGFWYLL